MTIKTGDLLVMGAEASIRVAQLQIPFHEYFAPDPAHSDATPPGRV